MAKYNLSQTMCFLFLAVAGLIWVDCARVRQTQGGIHSAVVQSDENKAESEAEGKADHDHTMQLLSDSDVDANGWKWCNPFSSFKTKTYHFDVEYNGNKCEDGECSAIEFIRDKEKPVLKIHQGEQWVVEKTGGAFSSNFSWSLFSPGPEKNEKVVTVNLLDTKFIKFVGANDEHADMLDIEHSHKNDSLGLTGGLYLNENIMLKNFDTMKAAGYKELQKNASKSLGSRFTGLRKGFLVGGAAGTFVAIPIIGSVTSAVASAYGVTAASLFASAIGLHGLLACAIGVVVAAGIGAGVGEVFDFVRFVNDVVEKKSLFQAALFGYKVKSASKKIFEKLRCLPEFKSCSRNIIVPKGKECPNEEE